MTQIAELEDRRATYAEFGPNWFASVMGTGIVATAAATLPVAHPALTAFATGVWALALALLALVAAVTVLHHRHHPTTARGWVDHAVQSHFHGATAMAPMSVAAATVVVGAGVLGEAVAVGIAAALWVLGTGIGLWTTASPRIRAARRGVPAEAFWLMPVVPPMVSAAVGALLAQHADGGLRVALLLASWAMFALAVVRSAPLIMAVVGRVAAGDRPDALPTLFIVLGPLGQSATAVLLLAPMGPSALHPVLLGYAVVVTAAALVWLLVSVATVVRARPGFTMTWWSFTFPVGTVVTGTSALAAATGQPLVAALAVILYAGLVAAWALVAARTVHGVCRGGLLR